MRVLRLKEPSNYDLTVNTLREMAIIHLKTENIEKAIECLQEKVAYIQKYRGLAHKDIAETFHRIGCIYASEKQFGKAIESHEKALSVKKLIHSEVNENTAVSLRYLGTCYDATGN